MVDQRGALKGRRPTPSAIVEEPEARARKGWGTFLLGWMRGQGCWDGNGGGIEVCYVVHAVQRKWWVV